MMTVFALLYKEMMTCYHPIVVVREPVPQQGRPPQGRQPDNYQYMFTVINILYKPHSMIDNPIIDIIGVHR